YSAIAFSLGFQLCHISEPNGHGSAHSPGKGPDTPAATNLWVRTCRRIFPSREIARSPVIGFLDGQSFDPYLMTAFREALKEAGYVEGRNVTIYFRSADGHTDRLVTLAGDIVGRRVAVIVTTGGGAAALAAYAATTTIPIVFVSGADPVASGLAMSLNRPGRNATGVYIFQQVLEGKRLGLLHGLV